MNETAPRTVLVSGGSRGLGAGLVARFLDHGDAVATFSRSATDAVRGWSARFPDRFLYESIDATDRTGSAAFVRSIIRRWGCLDVLINNAGVAHEGVLGTFPDEKIDILVDLNLKSTLHLTRAVVRAMLLRRTGRIINVSSVVGLSGYRGLSVYAATKAGLDGFTRSLARELGSRGITVNSIAPGYLRTEMTHGLSSEQLRQIVGRTPLGRLGEPADVADLALFLASPGASFITGQTIVIDGGLSC